MWRDTAVSDAVGCSDSMEIDYEQVGQQQPSEENKLLGTIQLESLYSLSNENGHINNFFAISNGLHAISIALVYFQPNSRQTTYDSTTIATQLGFHSNVQLISALNTCFSDSKSRKALYTLLGGGITFLREVSQPKGQQRTVCWDLLVYTSDRIEYLRQLKKITG